MPMHFNGTYLTEILVERGPDFSFVYIKCVVSTEFFVYYPYINQNPYA